MTPSMVTIWINRGKIKPIYYGAPKKHRKYLLDQRDVERAMNSAHRHVSFAPDDTLMSVSDLAGILHVSEAEAERFVQDNALTKFLLNWDKSIYFVMREEVAEILNGSHLDFVWFGS